MVDLSHPIDVQKALEDIQKDLADRQNTWESAARNWFGMLGKIEKDHAIAYRRAEGGATDKREAAKELHAEDGSVERAEYEALKAVVKVLETRATICMSLLKSQSRV